MSVLIRAFIILILSICISAIYRMKRFPVPPVLNPSSNDITNPLFGIVISGCSSGLGRSVVETLARKDPRALVFAGFRDIKDSEYLNNLDLDERRRVIVIEMDVTKQEQVDKALETVSNELAKRNSIPLYGIIANAGVGGVRNVLDKDEKQKKIRNTFEVNVFGATSLIQGFLPLLLKSPYGGRVITVSSLMGLIHTPSCLFAFFFHAIYLYMDASIKSIITLICIVIIGYGYCASKFALEALTASFRYDLEPKNISVSVIEPGFFKSDMCTKSYCKDDVSVCTESIFLSLFEERPLTRYTCASVFGIPANVVSYFINFIPDRMVDQILRVGQPREG